MKRTTRDNTPADNEIDALFAALFGDNHASPREIVKLTMKRLDAVTPDGIDYRAHLIETAMERGNVAGLVPDQLTVLAFRAFADSLEYALRESDQWKEDYIPGPRPEGATVEDKATTERG